MQFLPNMIFASRWLQMPLYLGLILAQGVYVWHFFIELYHLVFAAFGSQPDVLALVKSIGYKTDAPITSLNETVIMLVVLALIDVVMISNLLIMVARPPRSTRMAQSRERLGLEGKTSHRHHRHLVHSPAQNLHQRSQLHRTGIDVSNDYSHHLLAFCDGDCVHGQADVGLWEALTLLVISRERSIAFRIVHGEMLVV
jgi:hypothetical protein